MAIVDVHYAIRQHLRILGHKGHGVTELRIFKASAGPKVAYADNEEDAIRLCLSMEGKVPGIYVGVQPRPLHLFDCAPNQWKPALSGTKRNCAYDKDIEYITAVFFDIDVVSQQRRQNYPASDAELTKSLHAAHVLTRNNGFAKHATLCCSGNGHYVLVPIVPIPVDTTVVNKEFRLFCQQRIDCVQDLTSGVRLDPVFNLSRVMRMMGTFNRKGQATPYRPHRRAHFVTEPVLERSLPLHHMILNTELKQPGYTATPIPEATRCDLNKLESCAFIQWCRKNPERVSEPQWFALITNLVRLEAGIPLIHEISRLDKARYDYAHTQRVIDRVLRVGYKPQRCRSYMNKANPGPNQAMFHCSRMETCPAKAPMYMAKLHMDQSRKEEVKTGNKVRQGNLLWDSTSSCVDQPSGHR